MVREWGGDLISSSDKQGALLVLYLIAVPVDVPPPLAPSEVSRQEASTPVAEVTHEEPVRETILLVDDEAGIRGLVRRILRREHYNVIEAATGEEALAIALQHPGPIHVLLTDVMMPGVSGPQLAESVRERVPQREGGFHHRLFAGDAHRKAAQRFAAAKAVHHDRPAAYRAQSDRVRIAATSQRLKAKHHPSHQSASLRHANRRATPQKSSEYIPAKSFPPKKLAHTESPPTAGNHQTGISRPGSVPARPIPIHRHLTRMRPIRIHHKYLLPPSLIRELIECDLRPIRRPRRGARDEHRVGQLHIARPVGIGDMHRPLAAGILH